MWHPKRSQWVVMWVSLGLAFLVWLEAKEFVGVHLFIFIAAALLVWMLEGRRKGPGP